MCFHRDAFYTFFLDYKMGTDSAAILTRKQISEHIGRRASTQEEQNLPRSPWFSYCFLCSFICLSDRNPLLPDALSSLFYTSVCHFIWQEKNLRDHYQATKESHWSTLERNQSICFLYLGACLFCGCLHQQGDHLSMYLAETGQELCILNH